MELEKIDWRINCYNIQKKWVILFFIFMCVLFASIATFKLNYQLNTINNSIKSNISVSEIPEFELSNGELKSENFILSLESFRIEFNQDELIDENKIKNISNGIWLDKEKFIIKYENKTVGMGEFRNFKDLNFNHSNIENIYENTEKYILTYTISYSIITFITALMATLFKSLIIALICTLISKIFKNKVSFSKLFKVSLFFGSFTLLFNILNLWIHFSLIDLIIIGFIVCMSLLVTFKVIESEIGKKYI